MQNKNHKTANLMYFRMIVFVMNYVSIFASLGAFFKAWDL